MLTRAIVGKTFALLGGPAALLAPTTVLDGAVNVRLIVALMVAVVVLVLLVLLLRREEQAGAEGELDAQRPPVARECPSDSEPLVAQPVEVPPLVEPPTSEVPEVGSLEALVDVEEPTVEAKPAAPSEPPPGFVLKPTPAIPYEAVEARLSARDVHQKPTPSIPHYAVMPPVDTVDEVGARKAAADDTSLASEQLRPTPAIPYEAVDVDAPVRAESPVVPRVEPATARQRLPSAELAPEPIKERAADPLKWPDAKTEISPGPPVPLPDDEGMWDDRTVQRDVVWPKGELPEVGAPVPVPPAKEDEASKAVVEAPSARTRPTRPQQATRPSVPVVKVDAPPRPASAGGPAAAKPPPLPPEIQCQLEPEPALPKAFAPATEPALAPVEVPLVTEPSAPEEAAAAEVEPSKKRVLLIEDSITMRKIVQMALAAEPYEVTAMANGAQALDRARELRPDLVIADLSLDGKDGYEICSELRGDDELGGVPVLLLHGSASTYDAGRAEEVKASGELSKPFPCEDLIEKVRALTG